MTESNREMLARVAVIEALAREAGLGPILGSLKDGDDVWIDCDVTEGLEAFARLHESAETQRLRAYVVKLEGALDECLDKLEAVLDVAERAKDAG